MFLKSIFGFSITLYINVFNEIIRVALLPMSIGKSATINGPANVRPDKTATVSLLPVALLPVHHWQYASIPHATFSAHG